MKTMSESRWHQLWRDLRAVSEGGGGHVPLRWVQVEFCRALLHAAQIDIAVSYMDGSAPGTCPNFWGSDGPIAVLSGSTGGGGGM
jgi:hypothetical protein